MQEFAASPELSYEEQAAEETARQAWFQTVPHTPSAELQEAIKQAAWHPPAGSANTAPLVMVTQGVFAALCIAADGLLDCSEANKMSTCMRSAPLRQGPLCCICTACRQQGCMVRAKRATLQAANAQQAVAAGNHHALLELLSRWLEHVEWQSQRTLTWWPLGEVSLRRRKHLRPEQQAVAAGNYHALLELLPRWLDSLASTRDGDLTRHAVVVALGSRALDLCRQHAYSHQCVQQHEWPGPERQYIFASNWRVPVLRGSNAAALCYCSGARMQGTRCAPQLAAHTACQPSLHSSSQHGICQHVICAEQVSVFWQCAKAQQVPMRNQEQHLYQTKQKQADDVSAWAGMWRSRCTRWSCC